MNNSYFTSSAIFMLTLFLLTQNVNSQTLSCGVESEGTNIDSLDPNVTLQGLSPENLAQSCAIIYIGVHVHFFLEDDCSGGIQPANLDGTILVNACEADDKAGAIIDALNYSHQYMTDNPNNQNKQWNSNYWGAPISIGSCVPFRFVLQGVHVHCNSNIRHKQNESLANYSAFDVDPANAFNIYIADVNLSGYPTATGYTFYGENKVVVERIDPVDTDNLLSHEFGHTFGLRHTFENDLCDDTWGITLTNSPEAYHDINCNGTRDTGEGIVYCWSNSNDPYCDDQACDYHPCCQWAWQDNNVMTNSAWASNFEYSAYTDCQITRAIMGIGNYHSSRVVAIDPTCPPASAVISLNPIEDRLLFTSASRGYDEYKIDIFTLSYSLLKTTGWRTGHTSRYRLSDDPNLTPGQSYIARLTVNSNCGSSSEDEVVFIQPSSSLGILEPGPCEVDEPGAPLSLDLALFPNPLETGGLTVSFNLPHASTYQIYRIPLSNPGNTVQEFAQTQDVTGNQQIVLNTANWPDGVYGIYLIAEDLVDYELLVKN